MTKDAIITNYNSLSFKKYLNEVKKIPLLSLDAEVNLGYRVLNGDKKAMEALVRANLRSVITYAKPYVSPKIELEDLVNEGNIGLIKASETYDVTRGYRFNTYAVRMIRGRIQHYVNENGYDLRLPSGKIKDIRKVNRFVEKFQTDNDRQPNLSEIIKGLEGVLNKQGVIDVFNIKNDYVVSFDLEKSDNSSHNLHETVSGHEKDTAHLVEQSKEIESVRRILSVLSQREKFVLEHTFGLFGQEKMTFDQLGWRMDFTASRVQQINSNALKKLKGLAKSRLFQNVLS